MERVLTALRRPTHNGKDAFHPRPWLFFFSTDVASLLLLSMSKGIGGHPFIGRQTPAGGAHIFLGQPNIFFLSINAKDRAPWMANPSVQSSLEKIWRAEATAWHVGYYLLIPDHIHLFCATYDLHFGIDQWIAYWKSLFSKEHSDQPWEWQRRGVHHRLRDRTEYEQKLIYVRENPVRKGLVNNPTDWPFQRRIHDLQW
jgi:putative transposase